jgi:hypothetical protein
MDRINHTESKILSRFCASTMIQGQHVFFSWKECLSVLTVTWTRTFTERMLVSPYSYMATNVYSKQVLKIHDE